MHGHLLLATRPRTTPRPRPHGSSECPAATCRCSPCGKRPGVGWGFGVGFHRSQALCLQTWGPPLPAAREPHLGRQSAGPPAWRSADFRGCGRPRLRAICWERAIVPSSLHTSGTRGPRGQPLRISPALRGGREAQGNKPAEISRASYLPKPACSHISQNRVPGRDVNSEMQGQLQRKIVERNRQESCLLSPRVSEGSLEQARAMRGHLLSTTPWSPNRLKILPP